MRGRGEEGAWEERGRKGWPGETRERAGGLRRDGFGAGRGGEGRRGEVDEGRGRKRGECQGVSVLHVDWLLSQGRK